MTRPGIDPPSPAGGTERRPRRADARRNHDRLLAAAKEVFAEHGADAPLDDVARRAGVGNATMYRHFPTRQELLVAVYSDEVTELCARAEALLTADAPGDALFEWLHAFIAHVATKRELALALTDDAGGRRSALFDRWHEAMNSAASALVGRAQESRTVRPDLNAVDLLVLASGIALTGAGGDQVHRLVRLLRSGTDTPATDARSTEDLGQG
jgi:AcrR family transcriptional regulator